MVKYFFFKDCTLDFSIEHAKCQTQLSVSAELSESRAFMSILLYFQQKLISLLGTCEALYFCLQPLAKDQGIT